MSDKMSAFGSKMQDVGKSVSKVGGNLTKSVTLPLVGIGAAATAMAVDFDSSMTKMVSLVGLSRDEVDGMRGDIIDMASQFGKSAGEAADAMFFITSAGLRGSDAMETLEASLKGAAIGLGDVQTIADLATSAMNAYGAENLSATKATSVLRTAVEQGKLESSALAGAMGAVLPLSSALGISFDQAAAAMAAMSRTGTDAAAASTQLTAIMGSLVKETPQGAKALAKVGLSYEGIRKQIRDEGLLSALQSLVKAFGDDTIATAELFGNKRALVGVMDLMGAGAETTADIFGALAATTADDLNPAFEAAAETTGFKLQQAFSTLKNSLIEFGDIIAPFVEKFADRIKTLGEAFQNLSPQMKNFVVTAAGIAAAIGPVLLVVGKLISMGGVLVTAFAGITAAGAILAIKVVAVVAAIAAVAIAFKMMWDRSAALRKAVMVLIETVKNIASTLLNDLVGAVQNVIGDTEDLRSIFDKVARFLGDVLAVAVQALTRYWNLLANGLRVVIKIYTAAFKIIQMVANLIRGAVIAAIDILLNKLGPVSTYLRNVAEGARKAFSSIANIVSSAFRNALVAVEKGINLAIDGINFLIDAYNKLADVTPGVERMTRLASFEFKNMMGSASGASAAADHLTSNTQSLRYSQETLISTARDSFTAMQNFGTAAQGTGDQLDDLRDDTDNASDGASKASEAAERYTAALETMKGRLGEWRKGLKKDLDDAREEFFAFARDVSRSIMGAIDLGGAAKGAKERAADIAAAEKTLADARAEAAKEGAGESAQASVLAAEDELARAKMAGEKLGLTFMEALQAQAAKAREFAGQIRTLISMGINKDSPLMQMIIGEGAESGGEIAGELIAGGAEAINQATDLLNAVQKEADDIGLEAADHFKGAGVASAHATVLGFDEQFGPGGPGRKQLMKIMNKLAKKMARQAVIDIEVTKNVNEVVTRVVQEIRSPFAGVEGAGATGAIVRRPTVALIGEAGPEALLPLNRTRGNAPLSDLRGGGGITINVNAGMGTDGAQVGRQIVDALKQYEKRNGPIPVKVA
jgi:TP901 family phage tail tape measure protein